MKQVLAEAGVPTARHSAFGAVETERALAYLEEFAPPYVVKTDGLAAGKGVVVTESLADARDAVRAYLSAYDRREASPGLSHTVSTITQGNPLHLRSVVGRGTFGVETVLGGLEQGNHRATILFN